MTAKNNLLVCEDCTAHFEKLNDTPPVPPTPHVIWNMKSIDDDWEKDRLYKANGGKCRACGCRISEADTLTLVSTTVLISPQPHLIDTTNKDREHQRQEQERSQMVDHVLSTIDQALAA